MTLFGSEDFKDAMREMDFSHNNKVTIFLTVCYSCWRNLVWKISATFDKNVFEHLKKFLSIYVRYDQFLVK